MNNVTGFETCLPKSCDTRNDQNLKQRFTLAILKHGYAALC